LIYFDTSFLTPVMLDEPASVSVRGLIAGLRSHPLSISLWTKLEFASALAKSVRSGRLGEAQSRLARTRFESTIGAGFQILAPLPQDFELAWTYVENRQTGLRGGDALHLAIAANHNASAIYSLDKTFLKAGAILGLPVQTA